MNLEATLRPWRSLDVECLFVLLCVSVLCIESGCLHFVSMCLPEAVKCTSLSVCTSMYGFLVSEYDRERMKYIM